MRTKWGLWGPKWSGGQRKWCQDSWQCHVFENLWKKAVSAVSVLGVLQLALAICFIFTTVQCQEIHSGDEGTHHSIESWWFHNSLSIKIMKTNIAKTKTSCEPFRPFSPGHKINRPEKSLHLQPDTTWWATYHPTYA